MIVTCEACSSRYKIRPEKLPPQGGKIRCPSCQHVFIVRPEVVNEAPTPAKPASPIGDDEPTNIAPAPRDPKAAPAPASPAPAASAPEAAAATNDTAEAKAWKVRVSGLTYTFQDVESVQGWLSNRENVDGIKIAIAGQGWGELGDYPDVLTDALKSRFFGGGEAPVSDPTIERPISEDVSRPSTPSTTPVRRSGIQRPVSQPIRPRPARPRTTRPSRGKAKQSAVSRKNAAKAAASSGRAKIMLIALAVMVATAVALQLTGVIDLGSTLGFSDPTNQIPEGNFGTPAPTNGANKGNTNTTNTNNTNAGDEPDGGNTTIKVVDSNPNEGQEDPAEARRRLEQEGINENLDAARNYLADNQCAVPRGVLEALAVKHPENIEIKQTLLDVYTCLKLKDEARDLKKSIEDLKGSAPEDDGKKRRRRKKDQ